MKLSPHQKKVLAAFDTPGRDIGIVILYVRVYGAIPTGMQTRQMQQKLAPTFHAINVKLKTGKILPGQLKRTYRYSSKKKA